MTTASTYQPSVPTSVAYPARLVALTSIWPTVRSFQPSAPPRTVPSVDDRPTKAPRRIFVPPSSPTPARSEEHTSELQSLMRNSYAVFCLKKKKPERHNTNTE